jgi:hypothetical protein
MSGWNPQKTAKMFEGGPPKPKAEPTSYTQLEKKAPVITMAFFDNLLSIRLGQDDWYRTQARSTTNTYSYVRCPSNGTAQEHCNFTDHITVSGKEGRSNEIINVHYTTAANLHLHHWLPNDNKLPPVRANLPAHQPVGDLYENFREFIGKTFFRTVTYTKQPDAATLQVNKKDDFPPLGGDKKITT